jgi:hypothetical protein
VTGHIVINLYRIEAKAEGCYRTTRRQGRYKHLPGGSLCIELRLAAEAITPLTTWSAIHDEALKKPRPTGYPRSDLKPARTSSENSCGCSQAAKWPPLARALKWMRLW